MGGASEIAYNIIPTVEEAGGRVLVRSKVTKILVDGGRAVGVTVKQGESHVHPLSLATPPLTGHAPSHWPCPLPLVTPPSHWPHSSHWPRPLTTGHTHTGHTLYDVMAPLVISDAGLYNTVESLLPPATVKDRDLSSLLTHVRHGLGLMSVFIGLDGTPEELGLKAGHTWAFRGAGLQQITADFLATPPEDVESAKVRVYFELMNE